MFKFSTIFAVVFLSAFIVLLLTTNVRWALNSVELYEQGFDRHNVQGTTGLSEKQLTYAANQIRDYFNSSEDLLEILITSDDGTTQDLYKNREIIHMYDVKALVQLTYRVQEGAFLYLLLVATLGFLILGNDFAGRFRKLLLIGSLFNISVAGLIGIAVLIDFEPLFIMFHEISFNNDFWQLDPSHSYLVRMFPLQFWLECIILIGFATMVESVLIIMLIAIIKSWQRWRREILDRKAPQFV